MMVLFAEFLSNAGLVVITEVLVVALVGSNGQYHCAVCGCCYSSGQVL
jgi:hypothetical protein